jgi:hypothetical protein
MIGDITLYAMTVIEMKRTLRKSGCLLDVCLYCLKRMCYQ